MLRIFDIALNFMTLNYYLITVDRDMQSLIKKKTDTLMHPVLQSFDDESIF